MRDLKTELNNFNGYPPAWKPSAGETLVGTITSFDVGQTRYGPVRTVMIQDEGSKKQYSIWLSRHVLREQFEQQKPGIGDRIGLKYLGYDKAKGYHRYRLVVDRDMPVEFSPLGGEEQEDF